MVAANYSRAFALLRKLLLPSAEFADQKYRDHRRFTAIVLAILAVYLTLLWGWDYVTDPIGARSTIYLRLTYLLILPLALGLWVGKSSRRFLLVSGTLIMLLVEMVFVGILHQLNGGMDRGLGGFMYIPIILILLTQGLPLTMGIACTLGAVALPQLMAAAGLAPELPVERYALLMWPATGLVVLVQVVTAIHYVRRNELEAQLKLLSATDALTGVRNRRYFMPLLDQEVERARRFDQNLSLLMLDLDRFKQINDAHGHPTGDRVICRLTDLCRQTVREIDVVARIGGEEFCVLLPGSQLTEAAAVAERIRAEVEETVVMSLTDVPIRFTVSIGVAALNSEDRGGFDLFERADAALYAAKDSGRNQVACR
jgi:diguanylate cyclase (GGDEF)-like protein